jgi:lipocalin
LRLLASGDPQSAGEGRDDDGRQRSNRRLIRFYKPTRASYVAINSDTESGWVFFGGPSALSLS